MGPILALLGGPIFGALFGFIKGVIAKKMEDNVRVKHEETNQLAIKYGNFKEYQKQIDEGPVTPSYRLRLIGLLVLSFGITYNLGVIWFVTGGQEPVFTWAPEPDSFDISLLFDLVSYQERETKVFQLSSNGVGMYLMGMQMSIMSQFIVGESIKSFRK